jgi:GPI mannosyltransferase 2
MCLVLKIAGGPSQLNMDSWSELGIPIRTPLSLLFLLFALWKAVLFLVILCSPGPGYDTSTTLLDFANLQSNHQTDLLSSSPTLSSSLLKLVRWDAIYFSQLSHRGRVFEQEWAFGVGLSGPVSFISTRRWILAQALHFTDSVVISQLTGTSSALVEIGTAVVLSHIAHFLTVLLLYALSRRVSSSATSIIAAALHIISPAGAFLSAPYSESLFSTLNILGFYLYLDARITGGSLGGFKTIVAGISFGCATLVRSNGILGGLPFLYDAILQGLHLLRAGISTEGIRKLLALCAGGLLIALGALLPQYEAYQKFCRDVVEQDRRPWCDSQFPSIYGWVQRHYWLVVERHSMKFAKPVQECWSLQILDIIEFAALFVGNALLDDVVTLISLGLEISYSKYLCNFEAQAEPHCFRERKSDSFGNASNCPGVGGIHYLPCPDHQSPFIRISVMVHLACFTDCWTDRTKTSRSG